jgi:hypothetical protein
VRSRLSAATAPVSSIEIVVLLIATRSMALRKFATGLAVSSPSAIVHLPFPALEPERPSGWASEIAIDRVNRERRLRLTAPVVEVIDARSVHTAEARRTKRGTPQGGVKWTEFDLDGARDRTFHVRPLECGDQLACPDHCSVKRISMRRFLA